MSSKSPRNKLLSSGIPLEYHVAKLIATHGFSVSFDYTYSRFDVNKKEYADFSVDIEGLGFYPYEEENIEALIHLLVECKYRQPKHKWLFIPEVNNEEFMSFSSSGVLKKVDHFSKCVAKNFVTDIIAEMPICLKGTEIYNNGEVKDYEFLHGINQLQYALPTLLNDCMTKNLLTLDEDNHPFFICPIVVTTADLYVLKEGIGLDHFKGDYSDISEIAEPVEFLSLYRNTSPEFRKHCKNIFSLGHSVNDLLIWDNLERVKALRIMTQEDINCGNLISHPSLLLDSINMELQTDFFQEILICNLNSFSTLIDEIKVSIKHSIRSSKDLNNKK